MSDFKFSQDYVVYKAKKEGVYPIRETDWSRLKRLIQSIIPNKRIFQIISSVFWGIFASSIFSLFAFHNAEDISMGVITTNWIIFFVSLIGGIGLLYLDQEQKNMITLSTNDVLTEMHEIEKSFEDPESEEATDE